MRSYSFVAAALLSIASVTTPGSASAQSYIFKALASFDGGNGQNPTGGLIVDGQGNLFGTTLLGGPDNEGTVFELPAGTSTPVTLAAFNGTNGANPQASLFADSQGNFFGLAPNGGANGNGVVFEVTADGHTLLALASFSGVDGAFPTGALVADSQGDFFGTTQQGGTGHSGNVFELPAGSHAPVNLASFTAGFPEAGVILDAQGNLFGTTFVGGANSLGSVFKLPAGGNIPITLVSFNGNNGANPVAGLLADSHGNFFGVAQLGGSSDGGQGNGVIFELASGTSSIATLARFNGENGSNPLGTLIADAEGNLFGTTVLGGAHGMGTVFELPAGSDTPKTLFDFDGVNGNHPQAGLVVDSHGNLFGTAPAGGPNNNGVIFELVRVNVPGDYDANGIVDAADYTVWRDMLGRTGTGLAADGDGDHMVTQNDYDVWKTNFGNHSGSGSDASATAAVSEPSTLMMLLTGILTMCCRREPKVP